MAQPGKDIRTHQHDHNTVEWQLHSTPCPLSVMEQNRTETQTQSRTNTDILKSKKEITEEALHSLSLNGGLL